MPTAKDMQWLKTNLVYEGLARAEFENPFGFVVGKAVLVVGENGDMKVAFNVTGWESDDASVSDAIHLFQKEKRHYLEEEVESSFKMYVTNTWRNICRRLTIETDEGTVTTLDESTYFQLLPTVAYFYPRHATYKVNSNKSPHYWVFPLLNFVTEFSHLNRSAFDHPLRLLPRHFDGTSERQVEDDNYCGPLIGFEYSGEVGFIEPMPDYENREEKLKSGVEKALITSIMVGACPANQRNADLADLLFVLGFATGRDVSASWMELRDADGQLVGREHSNWGTPNYTDSQANLSPSYIGRLIQTSLTSLHFGKVEVRAALRQIAKSGSKDEYMDDRLVFIFRSLERLAKHPLLGIKQTRPIDYLTPSQIEEVKKILSSAQKQFQEMAEHAEKHERSTLIGLANKVVASVDGKRGDFADSLLPLLAHPAIQLCDVDIMVRDYNRFQSKTDKPGWINVINQYRNRVMHDGYFLTSNDIHTPQDVHEVMVHLHDIAVRVLLKLLNFDGKYLSLRYGYEREIDWVKPETTASKLGYK